MNHYVRFVGHVNEWVGRIAGLLIVAVVLIILKEVIGRGVFNAPSLWADESMTYLAGMAYALGGGFTLLHRKHVIVDLVYQPIADRGGNLKKIVDIIAFGLFSIYCLTLIFAIPIAGALLLLQGLANLLVDLGLAPNPAAETDNGR
jgi:TRAP-type mannitol/chloroaromatic compound transport system permease small subunit